jgi:hypothetical protein
MSNGRAWNCDGCNDIVDTGDDEVHCTCEAVFCTGCYEKLKKQYGSIEEEEQDDEEWIRLSKCWSCDPVHLHQKKLAKCRLSLTDVLVDLYEKKGADHDDTKALNLARRVIIQMEKEEENKKRKHEEKEEHEKEKEEEEDKTVPARAAKRQKKEEEKEKEK